MCILTRAIIVVQRDTHSVSLTTLVLFYFFSLISGPQRQRPPNDLHWDEDDIHPLFFCCSLSIWLILMMIFVSLFLAAFSFSFTVCLRHQLRYIRQQLYVPLVSFIIVG